MILTEYAVCGGGTYFLWDGDKVAAYCVYEYENGELMEFVDNGHTGMNFDRPAIQELLTLVQAGKVDCIIVKDFSRFGRNSIETGYFIESVFP